MNIGIIGCGNIGTELAMYIDKNKVGSLVYVCDREQKNIQRLKNELTNNNPETKTISEIIEYADLIIETATNNVAKNIIETIQHDTTNKKYSNKKIIILSSGGLIDHVAILNSLPCEIIVPSGAIVGLDGIKAVKGKIGSLELQTTKKPASLANAPYIQKNNINLEKITKKELLFEGSLQEAIEGFPQNINVAATLYLASGFENMKIKIYADPDITTNTHEITCKGPFGTIQTVTENMPSKNPKTSYLAVLSAVSELQRIDKKI